MKKIATLMFVALTSFAIVSCGGEESKDEKKEDKKETKNEGGSDEGSVWSQDQQDKFMKTCVERAEENPQIDGEEYCGCMLDKVMAKYPDPNDAGQMDMKWMQEEAAKCLGL